MDDKAAKLGMEMSQRLSKLRVGHHLQPSQNVQDTFPAANQRSEKEETPWYGR